jgi:hypothetical protein
VRCCDSHLHCAERRRAGAGHNWGSSSCSMLTRYTCTSAFCVECEAKRVRFVQLTTYCNFTYYTSVFLKTGNFEQHRVHCLPVQGYR